MGEAGELLYTPAGVNPDVRSYHVTLALEDSVGCSEQLVDEGNLVSFVENAQEEYDPEDAVLGCTVASKHWPDLLKPLSSFCAKAVEDLAAQAHQQRFAEWPSEL